jgi:putative ABC transport system permease protein
MRTWLTILGISVGISTVVFLVSLGYGLQKILLERIVFNDALLSLTVTPTSEALELTPERVKALSQIQGVKAVAPLAVSNGQVLFGEVNGTVEVRGADRQYFDYAGVSAEKGELYTDKSTNAAVVSDAVLRLFGVEDPATVIGKPITVKMFAFSGSEATGTLNIVSSTFRIAASVKDTQNSFMFIPLAGYSKLTTVNKYEQVQIHVNSSQELEAVKSIVIERGYQVQSLQETINQANKIFQIFQIVLGLFGAVALIVSAIGMFNTMTVTLLERTNEIGIMRALGASKVSIRQLFLTEAIILGALGGLVGLGLGILGAEIINLIINRLAERFGGSSIGLFYYPLWFMLLVFGISGAIGLWAGVFPAHRASTMDPLEALRYK